MAVVDTALLLLCRSHQAHSVDNQMLASLLLCLSSMFSWYHKAQLGRFPCVAFGTHAEEQPSHLNCSYLQHKKKEERFDEIISIPREIIFSFFLLHCKDIHPLLRAPCYLLKVAPSMSSINKVEVCTSNEGLALKILMGTFPFLQLSITTSLAPSLKRLWEKSQFLSPETISVLFFWPILPPFILFPVVSGFPAKACPGTNFHL